MADTDVVLGGVTFTTVIGFNRKTINNVFLSDWVNSPVEVDENVIIRHLEEFEYVVRASDSEKWALEQKLESHQNFFLADYVHKIEGYVWIKNIDSLWTNVDYLYPWEININILSEGVTKMIEYEGDYTTWTLQGYCPLSLPSFPSTLWVAWDTANDLMYILESNALYVVDLNTGTYDTYASTDAYWYSQCFSLMGRYLVAYNTGSGIKIFKDGAIIQTLTPPYKGGAGVYMSPDGKWIVYQSWTKPAYVCDPLYIYKGT